MSFQRQIQRASQKQELDLLHHTMQSLADDNERLTAEVKSLHRAMGALVIVAGGELSIPRDIDSILKGKHLTTDVVEATGEIIFRVVDATTAVEETAKEVATN